MVKRKSKHDDDDDMMAAFGAQPPQSPPKKRAKKTKKKKTIKKKTKTKKTDNDDGDDEDDELLPPLILKRRKEIKFNYTIEDNIQSGNKAASEWWLNNVNDGRIVISHSEVYRWREDKKIWEHVRRDPSRLIADQLWRDLRVDVGKSHIAASLWKHSITGLTQDKEMFHDVLDRKHKDLLPIADGKCIRLRSGEIIDRVRGHLFTYSLPVTYVKTDARDEKCVATLDTILTEIGAEQTGWVDHVQRVLGYSITGETHEQLFWVWWGKAGSNGKGFLGRMLSHVLGKRVMVGLRKQLFLESAGSRGGFDVTEGPSPHTMTLKKGRLGMVTECAPGDKMKIDMMLRITGEDTVSARGLNKDPDEFHTQDKIHMQVNDVPEMPTDHTAFMRRPRVISFAATFQPPHKLKTCLEHLKRYNSLKDKANPPEYLKAYPLDVKLEVRFKPGGDLHPLFFSWLVDGAVKWYKNGLGDVPECLQKATNEAIHGQDIVAEYMRVRCELTDRTVTDRIAPNELHNDFLVWYKAHKNDERVRFKKADLKRALLKKGWLLQPYKGINYWRGVRLLPKPDSEMSYRGTHHMPL